MLARPGFKRPDTASMGDGQEALGYPFVEGEYRDRHIKDVPRVVFLDINLPKHNRLEVLRRIRSHEMTTILPVVLLTSSDEPQDMIEGCKSGANSHVRKAYELDEFIASMNALLDDWLNLNLMPYE